eukprot:8186410-Pyramimonas_sp.AAC.1
MFHICGVTLKTGRWRESDQGGRGNMWRRGEWRHNSWEQQRLALCSHCRAALYGSIAPCAQRSMGPHALQATGS